MATISPTELRLLLKLQDTGSFTAAAAALDIDKSQVSRTVARVERRLGVRLFERSTRASHPTALGAEVCARAREVLTQLSAIENLAARAREVPSGTLRIGCGVEFGVLAVAGWIADYLARHPAVGVDADFSNRVVDVIEEGFDLVIRLGATLPTELAAVRLGALRYGLYASPALLARTQLPPHPAGLAPTALLRYSGGSHAAGWRLTRAGESVTMRTRGRASLNNVQALADATRAGLGIARLPRLLAENYVGRGELEELYGEWALEPVPVHAVLPGNRYIPPKVSAFLEVARTAMHTRGMQ